MAVRDVVQAAAGNTPAGDLAAAIDFDGTNDYLSRASDLTGNADGKTFTFSAWIYETSGNSKIYHIDNGSGSTRFQIAFDGTGASSKLEITGTNASGTTVLNIDSLAGNLALNTWQHILVSIDLTNSSNRHIYINGVSQTVTWNTYSNDNIDFTSASYLCVGAALYSGGSYSAVKGRLSNVFLDYTYRDLSVTNNRRLFITEDGKPADGQASLNPIMYMPLDDPEDIGYNAGTGGDFTVNGVMARSGRGPNQYNAAASSMFTSGQNVTLANVGLTTTGYTISANVKTTLGVTVIPFWVSGSGTNYQTQMQVTGTTGVIRLNVYDYATSTTVMRITADTALVADRFYNIQMVVDPASTANTKFYVDGVQVATTVVIFVSRTNHILTFTAQVYGTSGTFSDVYFTDGKIDLSTDNPFYDTETNKPKYLGESGELPTGSSPLIYLPLRANDAGNNLGTGGDFTVNSGPFTGARGPSEFIARSVSFNGTNQSLTRATTLTGAKSAGSGFTFALSVKVPSTTTYFPIYVGKDIGVANYLLFALGNNKMYATVPFYNYCDTDNNSISGLANTWINVLFTVTKNGSWQYWINGVDKSEGAGTFTATSDFDFTSIDTSIIGTNGSADYAPASLGFFWATDEYIDFSQEATRLKFFDGLGYPVDLGEDGSIPTGNQPLIYMNNNFHLGTNSGGGGNFSPDNAPPAGPDVGS